jgi:hypothetical protein
MRYHLRMKRSTISLILLPALFAALAATTDSPLRAAPVCTPTGYVRDGINLTAALINPAMVRGNVNATGCHIGVYYGPGASGEIKNANIAWARYFGVVVDGSAGSSTVDIIDSTIHAIGESPQNGLQHGVGIYYAAFNDAGTAGGRVSGNHLFDYQKGGIVVNGPGASVLVQDNNVEGQGAIGYIAQNGIQFGYGSSGSIMRNTVTGHSFTGASTVSGGILVVGGPGYGTCGGNPCQFTTGIQIVQNIVSNNDIGVFLTNLEADSSAPSVATNSKAINNVISNSRLTNGYGGFGYQAGVSDVGNNDKIVTNRISGAGYDPVANPSAYTVAIDADASFTNRPKVHANK